VTFFWQGQVSIVCFAICELVTDLRSNSFFWPGQVLCSTFCHLRVSCRFEVKLAAHRFGTNFHLGSPLGGLYPLSSRIFCVSVMPRQKPTDANLQEVLPHTWDTKRDKKQICKSVSLREKKVKKLQTCSLAQLADLEIWNTLLGGFLNCARCVFSIFLLPDLCQIVARSLPDWGDPRARFIFVPDF
jgi:hypothetical protein